MKYAPPIGQEAQGEDAHYIDGNPELGILGSPVPAAAIEQGQRELLHVIKQAGLTPSGDDLTQLYEAILKIIGVQVPVASKTETGLVQIGDGLQITPEGLLSVLVASVSQAGIMRPDGTTCTVVGGVLSVLQQADEHMGEWRTSWIGVPRPWRSTALPPSHCWANGDFVAFADWPELEQVYAAGGFEGMLMAWDADSGTQAANPGQWRPDAAEPTGLYVPVLTGQFMRCWEPGADVQAGGYNAPGLPNIIGTYFNVVMNGQSEGTDALYHISGYAGPMGAGTTTGYASKFGFDASRSTPIYGASPTVMPPSINTPYIIYLGNPAKETA